MIEAIHRLAAELRKTGLPVSPAELIDAAQAAQAVGVESKDAFRLALRATLAKTRQDAAIFERVFARVFTGPAPPPKKSRRGRRGQPEGQGEGKRPRAEPAPEEGKAAGKGRRHAEPDDERKSPGHRSPKSDETPRRFRPGRLTFLLRSGDRRPQAVPRRSMQTRVPVAPRARRTPPPRHGQRRIEPRIIEPRRVDLKRPMSTAEETILAREIPRLIQEIRLKVGRRRRPGRQGRLWTTKLIRSSALTEGVPFVIPMRERRPRRPRLIVLADVSWSVLRASSFFLQMAEAFVLTPRLRRQVSVFLFVDSCVEATRLFDSMEHEHRPLTEAIDTLPLLNLQAPSDYGRAFHQAAHSRQASHAALRTGGRDTVLVVLGDARNNFGDPQAWAFEDLASRCRRVIWLVPEPVALWDTGDSVLSEYLPSCDVVCEAGDLDGIAAGVAAMVRSL